MMASLTGQELLLGLISVKGKSPLVNEIGGSLASVRVHDKGEIFIRVRSDIIGGPCGIAHGVKDGGFDSGSMVPPTEFLRAQCLTRLGLSDNEHMASLHGLT